MTEFELIEVMDNFSTQMMMSTTLFFTLLSAYLITAYFVGTKLSKTQVVIVSAMYFVWAAFLPIGQYTYSLRNAAASAELYALGSVYAGATDDVIIAWSTSFMILQYLALIASLYFMWRTRHPKIG